MATGRFERLERERGEGSIGGARPSVEARFGGGQPGGEMPPSGPERSGAAAGRFESGEGAGLPLLDTDGGQAFVRCALCRADSFANAVACSSCGADLRTPAQRAFNADLWQRLSRDQAEMEREVAALRERRAVADREQADAVRRAPVLLRELERRRALGLPLDDADDVSNPLVAASRALGRVLGRTLARLVALLVRQDGGGGR